MNFENKVVVITGASSGIGESTVRAFANENATLALVARNKDKLDHIAKQLDTKTLVYPCDVSDKSQVESMAREVLSKLGKIDILVNNAGFAIYGSVSELTIDEIEAQINTNYLGMVYCTKNFLPHMLKQNSGHIVNVASVAASFGLPGIASYCASKFAMLGFSEGLKHELSNTKVGVTVVSPIMVRTNFFDHKSFPKISKYPSTSLDPKTVAKAILKASTSSRLEIIVPSIVRCAVWAKHTFPYLVNPIVSFLFKKQLK